MELFSLLHTLCLLCVVFPKCWWFKNEREPPFIGGEEGICFLPTWKAPNQPQTAILRIYLSPIPCNHHWRGGVGWPTKDGPKARQIGCGRTSTGPKWPQLWCVAFIGPLDGSCKIWRHLETIWYGFWPFFSTWLGPDLPGSGPPSPGANVGWWFAMSFKHISCVILTYPPTNDESPKLVQFVRYKP